MQIRAISPVTTASTATTGTPAATTTASKTTKALGQDDFLKLLSVQFQNQDPMKPMEDTSFIAQMAQFTALDQASAMSKDIAALRADQQLASANSYLGHRVTVDVGDGTTAAGDVSAIDATGAAPQIVIGGVSYPLSSVLLVEPGSVSTPAPLPVSAGGASNQTK